MSETIYSRLTGIYTFRQRSVLPQQNKSIFYWNKMPCIYIPGPIGENFKFISEYTSDV